MTIKQMIVRHIISIGDVSLKCAEISVINWDEQDMDDYRLPVDYTQEEIDKFMDDLDYTRENSVIVTGTLWFTDGSFSISNGGFVHNLAPDIPNELKR